jgi:hypothetical protein
MTAERSASNALVGIRDRRELPFFQVRMRAVQAIRNETSGPRRLRAIGFYALLCQLANEQRHTGEHRVIRVTYDVLATRGQMSKRSVKLMLDALERSEVVRYERVSDRATGAVVSFLHLLILDDPWIGLTVAMADHLAAPRPGGHLLRDLGLVVIFLEFCAEQREQHGGLTAEVMRSDVATRSGLTIDRVDDCNRALEQAGLLEIVRRRASNGGRHLPSVYTIREAPTPAIQGGALELTTRRNGTGRAAHGYPQGGATVPAAPRNGTSRAEDEYRQGGESATPSTVSPPSSTHTGSDSEQEDIETPFARLATGRNGNTNGGGEVFEPREELCNTLIEAWQPALGDSPQREYTTHRTRWLDSAGLLLERHPRPRLDAALAYMVTDEILGSQALTMPGFAKVADQLIARAYARQQRSKSTGLAKHSGTTSAATWEEAKQALQRAIQRHGREDRAAALHELAKQDERLVRFVERVKWSSLCEQPFQYVDRRYAELWAELVHQANEPQESAA